MAKDRHDGLSLPQTARDRLRDLYLRRQIADLECQRFLEGLLAGFGERLDAGDWVFDDEAGTLTLQDRPAQD